MAGVNCQSFLLAKPILRHWILLANASWEVHNYGTPPHLSQSPIFPPGDRALIPYHVAREDTYGPDGFDPDAQVSFCTRGQVMALVIYDLEEEADWKNDLDNRRCFE